MNTFLINPHGWWYFTVLFSDTANPTWPIQSNPTGAGQKVVQAGAPATLLTPVGRKLILRGVFDLTGDHGVRLLHGDGSTAYFNSGAFSTGADTGKPALAIPLHNGLSAIAVGGTGGLALVCYEPLDI